MGVSRFALSPEDGLANLRALLGEFGPRAVVIVHQDTPQFLAESCAYANLIGGCPGKANCTFESMEMVSSHGERVTALDYHCRTIVLNQGPFCLSTRLDDLRQAGAVSLRADFVYRQLRRRRRCASVGGGCGRHRRCRAATRPTSTGECSSERHRGRGPAVVKLFSRVRRWWGAAPRRTAAHAPFDVACPCGQHARGLPGPPPGRAIAWPAATPCLSSAPARWRGPRRRRPSPAARAVTGWPRPSPPLSPFPWSYWSSVC